MTGSNFGYNNAEVISSLPYGSPAVATSSILSFSIPSAAFFREPTLLAKPDTTAGGTGLSMTISNPDVTQLSSTTGSVFTNGGLISTVANPLGLPSAPASTQPYIGLYLGAFPLRWVGVRWSTAPVPPAVPPATPPPSYWVYTDSYPGVLGGPALGVTYSLQCQDIYGNWVTYDEKYVNTDPVWQWVPGGLLLDAGSAAFAFIDPRTSRFGSPDEANFANQSVFRAPATSTNWLDPTSDAFVTERPGIQAGFGGNFRTSSGTPAVLDWAGFTAAGWHYQNVGVGGAFFQGGLFAQNNPYFGSDGLRYPGDNASPANGPLDPEFYSDPDGVVRRGTGAYVATATGIVGQPLATASMVNAGKASLIGTQSGSRPKILNRPFRSVAELGYVFSGSPWKNLDFSTPESGYSELLDVFCVNETDDPSGLVAGKLDLNTRQTPVLAAVLAGTLTAETTGTPTLLDTGTGIAPTRRPSPTCSSRERRAARRRAPP